MQLNNHLIAHRGWQRHYPENTLIAIEAAINAGAKHIELDIQLTADLIPMLCHDRNLQRICGIDKNIDTIPYSETTSLSAHEPDRLGQQFQGTPLSSLEEFVTLASNHPEVTFYIEVKRSSLRCFGIETFLQATLPLLTPIKAHSFLISFDLDVLEQAQRAGWQRVVPVLTDLEQLTSDQLVHINPDIVFCDTELITNPDLIKAINYPIALYEVDQYDEAIHWLKQGAKLIESFAIGELIEQHSARIND